MKKQSIVFIFIAATMFFACTKETDKPVLTPKTIELTTKSAEVIGAANNFGIDLFVKNALEEDKNFMLSPLSASVALTMLLNGADGETYNQIKEMLGYPADSNLDEINNACLSLVDQLLVADNKVTLTLANAVFYHHTFPFKAPFISTLNTKFDAEVQSLDFALPSSVTTINKWAADQTNQKITKVIEEIDPLTVMFLMNALYFKGNWTEQFDKAKTTDLPFTLTDGTTQNVSTMVGEVEAIQTYGTNYSVLELPYGRKNFQWSSYCPLARFRISIQVLPLTPGRKSRLHLAVRLNGIKRMCTCPNSNLNTKKH
jgi:serpin B